MAYKASAPTTEPMIISPQEYAESQSILLQAIQHQNYATEKADLEANEVNLPCSRKEMKNKRSSIRTLNPFIASDGLIRTGSRLHNADMKDETKYPIILPRKDPNVRSLIRSIHVDNLHAGPKHVLNRLRQKFWIPAGLQEVRSVLTKCTTCQKMFKKPLEQKKAPLPPCPQCASTSRPGRHLRTLDWIC